MLLQEVLCRLCAAILHSTSDSGVKGQVPHLRQTRLVLYLAPFAHIQDWAFRKTLSREEPPGIFLFLSSLVGARCHGGHSRGNDLSSVGNRRGRTFHGATCDSPEADHVARSAGNLLG